MTGENRTLCYYGLEQINKSPRSGLKAIIDTLEKETITINELSFYLGPRINAAGRMDSGSLAVELLTEEDLEKAIGLAEKLNQLNIERRMLDKETTQQAIDQIKSLESLQSSQKTAIPFFNSIPIKKLN